MATRKIEKDQWQYYFEQLSRSMTVSTVDVEVESPEMGVQPQVSEVQLTALSYDPRDDAFSIISEGLEHRIIEPRRIAVQEENDELHSVEIVDAEARRHIARLKKAVRLPG